MKSFLKYQQKVLETCCPHLHLNPCISISSHMVGGKLYHHVSLLRSLLSAWHQRWQIRQPAPQNRLRKLSPRASARCKGPPDRLPIAHYACFVPVWCKPLSTEECKKRDVLPESEPRGLRQMVRLQNNRLFSLRRLFR